ncbi:MAG: MBL fold metallo-hydrolase [Candidatus Taylorbacteria bacterium]|nr:MBL fold metallo-hydrolase [Candidatus Taylorbacteria bacterium]
MSVKITMTARGGGNEVGGSLYDYLFDDGVIRELVRIDSGQRPSNFNSDIRPIKIRDRELAAFLDEMLVKPAVDPLPNWDTISELKHLFLTHSHFDHVAAVPYVLRKHRYATVYATPVTAKICKIQWFSTPRIAKRKEEIPLFNEEDAEFALSRIVEIHPGQRIRINDNLEIEPVEAGHLLGAVSFIFYWEGKAIGFHTGDFTLRNNQRSVPDAPEIRFDNLRFLTTESTKITERNPPRHTIEDEFKKTILDAYRKGMKIRIPSFAIGRIQEVFALVKEACPDAPIWIDGQAKEVSSIYAEHLGGVFFGIEKHFVMDNTQRLQIIHSREPNIVLSPSAMQFGGQSRKYIEHGCGQSDHLFISVGYRDPRSPEYAFFASTSHNDVFAFGAYKAARMCQTATFNFTSHCDGNDVLEMKARMNPDQTLLIHGDAVKMNEFVENHPSEGFVIAENNKSISV